MADSSECVAPTSDEVQDQTATSTEAPLADRETQQEPQNDVTDNEATVEDARDFEDISADDRPTEIESLCMNCQDNGITKLLLTRVPFFREVIVMAFECPHCGFSNNEVQAGAELQEKGCRHTLTCERAKDLDRQVVKSERATVSIPSLDFAVEPGSQQGQMTTVEGIISRTIEGLQQEQPLRLHTDPDTHAKIDAFCGLLQELLDGKKFPFQLIVDDPSGNSFIQNLLAPRADPQLVTTHYKRTKEQDLAIGILSDDLRDDIEKPSVGVSSTDVFNLAGSSSSSTTTTGGLGGGARMMSHEEAERHMKKAEAEKEVMCLPAFCAACKREGECRIVVTDIPHFKEIILMAFCCDYCGYKNNEVKAGGATPAKGRRVTCLIENFPLDLNRDILKSETASLELKELGLQLAPGTLGGRFTTVEGLLTQVYEQLRLSPFVVGDSSEAEYRRTYDDFLTKLQLLITGEEPFTIVIDDPLGNSYIQNVFAPDPDPNMTSEDYERTEAQNEELGLLDMDTEDYERL